MNNRGKISTEGILEAIKRTKPEILPEDLKRFNADKETFS